MSRGWLLICTAGTLIIVVALMQVWIFKGSEMERIDIKREMEINNRAIASLQKKIDILQRKIGEVNEELKHREIVQKIIDCESSGRHEGIWGDGGRSYGIAQFQKMTFYSLAAKALKSPNPPFFRGRQRGDWKNREDQIKLLAWAVKNGYGNLWSCYK
jgi:hypothetical protein